MSQTGGYPWPPQTTLKEFLHATSEKVLYWKMTPTRWKGVECGRKGGCNDKGGSQGVNQRRHLLRWRKTGVRT